MRLIDKEEQGKEWEKEEEELRREQDHYEREVRERRRVGEKLIHRLRSTVDVFGKIDWKANKIAEDRRRKGRVDRREVQMKKWRAAQAEIQRRWDLLEGRKERFIARDPKEVTSSDHKSNRNYKITALSLLYSSSFIVFVPCLVFRVDR